MAEDFDPLLNVGRWGVGFLWRCVRPTIKDFSKSIQTLRDQRALARSAEEMRQQIQSPDSPAESPASMPPMIATPDLSPPPTDNKKG